MTSTPTMTSMPRPTRSRPASDTVLAAGELGDAGEVALRMSCRHDETAVAAVRMALFGGVSLDEAARQVGRAKSTVQTWVERTRADFARLIDSGIEACSLVVAGDDDLDDDDLDDLDDDLDDLDDDLDDDDLDDDLGDDDLDDDLDELLDDED